MNLAFSRQLIVIYLLIFFFLTRICFADVGWSQLKLSQKDFSIAQNLYQIYKTSNKGYPPIPLITKTYNETKKSKNFNLFTPWLLNLKTLGESKNLNQTITFCQSLNKNEVPTENIIVKFNLKLKKNCRLKVLDLTLIDIIANKVIGDNSVEFIKSELKQYASKQYHESFSSFLQNLSKHPVVLKKITDLIITTSVQKNIYLTQMTVNNLHQNEDVTHLIQSKGYNENRNIFYSEFSSSLSALYKMIDKDNPKKKIAQSVNSLIGFVEANDDYLPSNLVYKRLTDFSRALHRFDHTALAQKTLRFCLKKNIKEIEPEIYFNLIWIEVLAENYKSAYELISEFKLDRDYDLISDTQLKYWIGHVLFNYNKKDRAVDLWVKLIKSHSISYYSIVAIKTIRDYQPDHSILSFYNDSIKTNHQPELFPKHLDEKGSHSFIRLLAWTKMDIKYLINYELKTIKDSFPDWLKKDGHDITLEKAYADYLFALSSVVNTQNSYLSSFKLIYILINNQELTLNSEILKILYPKPFEPVVLSKLKKSPQLDHLMILSLMRQESVFNPRAKSPVGARGLMQLMPNTAKRFKRSVQTKHLFNPQTNIDLGIAYLLNLHKRYDGNWVYVLGAYNAGESRIERWKKNIFNEEKEFIINVEMIPFQETRNYVKLISRNLFFYKLLNDPNLKINPEKNKIFDLNMGFKR